MIKRILTALMIMSAILLIAGCNGATPGPGGTDKPEPEPEPAPVYDEFNLGAYLGYYYAKSSSETADEWYTISFTREGSRSGHMAIAAVTDEGYPYQIICTDDIIHPSSIGEYGVLHFEGPEERDIQSVTIYQSYDPSAGGIRDGYVDLFKEDGVWTIDEGGFEGIYDNGHEWTDEELKYLMTKDELITEAEMFVKKVTATSFLNDTYIRMQPAGDGSRDMIAEGTFTDEVDGLPSLLMLGVKDGRWTREISDSFEMAVQNSFNALYHYLEDKEN